MQSHLYKTVYYNGRQFDDTKFQYTYVKSYVGDKNVGLDFKALLDVYEEPSYSTVCGSIFYGSNIFFLEPELESVKQYYQESISLELKGDELTLTGLMFSNAENTAKPWEYENNTKHETNNLTTSLINNVNTINKYQDIEFTRMEIITGAAGSGERIVNIYAKK